MSAPTITRPITASASAQVALPVAPAQDAPSFRDDLARAAERALAEGLEAVKNADGSWTCKEYTLSPFGRRAQDVSCNCPAGSHGKVCKHLAPVIWGRKYGFVRVRAHAPQAAPSIPDSTAEDIALSQQIAEEVRRDLVARPAGEVTPWGSISHYVEVPAARAPSDAGLQEAFS